MGRQTDQQRRDVVVVGASAGGVEALSSFVAALPADFAGAVFIVLHIAPTGSVLPSILGRRARLPVAHAEDGETIQEGRIYVAPPDCHLLVEPDRVRVVGGPRQNGHRPAIDPLFRTAAWAYGPRVAGVVLSGVQDDGALGARSIKRRGGMTLVQDPADAAYADMPQNAIEYDAPDHIASAAELARILVDAAAIRVDNGNPRPETVTRPLEVIEGDDERRMDGQISPFTCPECNGTLWEVSDGGLPRYRCRVGHSYSPGTMDAAQGTSVEAALWTALRSLEERSHLQRRLAERLGEKTPRVRARLLDSATRSEEHAEILRQMLDQLEAPTAADEPIVGGAA